jgi:hypothetical protein
MVSYIYIYIYAYIDNSAYGHIIDDKLKGKVYYIMKDYVSAVKTFFERFGADYTPEAIVSLTADMEKVTASPEASVCYQRQIDNYRTTDQVERTSLNEDVKSAAASAGISEKASLLLQYILLTEHMEELYQQKNISEQVYFDTVRDLSFKNRECQNVYHVWGLFTDWFIGFLNLKMFALGRLQYQHDRYNISNEPYTKGGVKLIKGETPALSIHIPSDGRLDMEDVIKSFRLAYEFFPEYRQNGKLIMQCSSWLLYPAMHDFMTPGSNLSRFQECFDILRSSTDPKFDNCWRLFNVFYTGDSSLLPRDTTLRRQYAEYLDKGGIAGSGSGVIVFDGNSIVNK